MLYINPNATLTGVETLTNKTIASHLAYTDTRYKLGSITRDISLTSTQAVTGFGYQPKFVRIWGAIGDTTSSSDGGSDGTNHYTIYSPNFNTPATGKYGVGTTGALIFLIDASNYTIGTLSMDADGFTITWTKTGSPTGTATMFYLGYR